MPESQINFGAGRSHFVPAAAGAVFVLSAFFLAGAPLAAWPKVAMLILIVGAFLALHFRFYRAAGSESGEQDLGDAKLSSENDLESKLLALEEADRYFATALKPADMFRLVSNRVREIFPFAASSLLLLDEAGSKFTVEFAEGDNAEFLESFEIPAAGGSAGEAIDMRGVHIDKDLALERSVMPPENLYGFDSAVSIPLIDDGEAFGVFQLYTSGRIEPNEAPTEIFEAIGERIGPMFRSSMSRERSLANALTDPLTSLPNERAFFVILENQLAESQRYRDERSLTVLAIDVKGFTEANAAFGHAAGDRILEFVASGLRDQLRKMDFLARFVNDEFLIILPTANETTAMEIAARIEASFAARPFNVAEDESVHIALNYGLATFWKDGETAHQLLHSAQMRKRQAKAVQADNVLTFRKEYVH